MNWLDELEELEAKATPGPWKNAGHDGFSYSAEITRDGVVVARFEVVDESDYGLGDAEADFGLIIALRNNATKLFAAVRMLKEVEWVDDTGGDLDWCVSCYERKWAGHAEDCKLKEVLDELAR